RSLSEKQSFLSELINYDQTTFMNSLMSCGGINQQDLLNALVSDNNMLFQTLVYLCNNGNQFQLEMICNNLGITYQACDPFPPFPCYSLSCIAIAENMRDYLNRPMLLSSLSAYISFNVIMTAINATSISSQIYEAFNPGTSSYSSD